MKAPMDLLGDGRRAAAVGGRVYPERVQGPKAVLRQNEFRQQRGLRRRTRMLQLDDIRRSVVVRAEPPPALYRLGALQREELLVAAPPAPKQWRELGPIAIPKGQTYGEGPGATATMAGRVTAIGVDPGDSAHLLIASAAGGVWESRDTGDSWTPRTDDQPTLAFGALAFSQSDPSRVYAGSGDGNSQYDHLGMGVLVSNDGGSSWELLAADVFADIGFFELLVDPNDRERVFAATTGGAAVSTDGCANWSLLHPAPTWDFSLAGHSGEEELLVAASDGLFAARGGGPLERIALPGLVDGFDLQSERIAVAHVPGDPEQAYAFAASRRRARLWRRAALDGDWKRVDLPSFRVGRYVDNVLDVAQAFYDWHLSIPPDRNDTIYLGAIELVKGIRDGDEWEWEDISSRIGNGDSIHPDQHAMAFDRQTAGVIYAGNDGGIFRSPDGGRSWTSLNAGLGISEVEYLTQHPADSAWLLAGLQDNGTIRSEGDGVWNQVALGDGGDLGLNVEHPDTCYHSYYYMFLERSRNGAEPDSWEDVTPPDIPGEQKLFYPPLEVNGSAIVKAGDVVHISTDEGDNWASVELPQPPSGRPMVASALAIPTHKRVLVGTIRGEIFAIDRVGGTWEQPSALTRPMEGWVSDLLVDPSVPERIWATFSSPGAVFRSDDSGMSWTDVTANLPQIPVNAVVNDPAQPDRVWVACDVGVFKTEDAGTSWEVFGTGLPNALAADLLFYEPDRLLRVGTRSRGVWEVAVD